MNVYRIVLRGVFSLEDQGSSHERRGCWFIDGESDAEKLGYDSSGGGDETAAEI